MRILALLLAVFTVTPCFGGLWPGSACEDATILEYAHWLGGGECTGVSYLRFSGFEYHDTNLGGSLYTRIVPTTIHDNQMRFDVTSGWSTEYTDFGPSFDFWFGFDWTGDGRLWDVVIGSTSGSESQPPARICWQLNTTETCSYAFPKMVVWKRYRASGGHIDWLAFGDSWGGGRADISGIFVKFAPVMIPEPSTGALAFLPLVLVAAARLRRIPRG